MTQLDLRPLIDTLAEMRRVHDSLVELCGGKSRAIMENNTAALSEAVRLENRLMNESRSLDRKRGEIVSGLAALLDTAPDELTVTMLAERAQPKERDELLGVQAGLLAALNTQKTMNGKCRVLLEAHMEYAEMVLNLMVGDEDPLNNIYGSAGSGPKERRQTAGLLDTKA